MPYASLYLASGARLLPLAGGPVIIPSSGQPGDDPAGNVGAMLVGAASASLNGSDFPDLDTAAGPFTCRRSYDTTIPASFAASAAGIDAGARASIWSCKPDLDQLASGLLDAAITSFVASIPDAHVAWLTCWHEPDGKIRKNEITLAAYLPAFRRFCDLVHAVGKPYVYTTQIIEAWSGQHPQPGSTYADLWPGDGYIDTYGVDGYSTTGSGTALWGPAVAFAAAKNIGWGIAEVGCGPSIDVAWMSEQDTYAATHAAGGRHTRCCFFCWFSNPTGGVTPTPGDDPAARAVAQTISRTYYADPNSFIL